MTVPMTFQLLIPGVQDHDRSGIIALLFLDILGKTLPSRLGDQIRHLAAVDQRELGQSIWLREDDLIVNDSRQ